MEVFSVHNVIIFKQCNTRDKLKQYTNKLETNVNLRRTGLKTAGCDVDEIC